MSGFVPKRVSNTRTAMGSTDAESTGMNGHSIVSTLGRRSTLLNRINKKSFGSIYQINYFNALTTGDTCTMEDLAPVKSSAPLQLAANVFIPMILFRDNFTTGFVTRTMQNELVKLYDSGVFTDKYCSFGDILNNTGDAIFLPNNLQTATGGAISPCAGWRLVAFERWYSGGPKDGTETLAQLSGLGGWEALFSSSTPGTADYNLAQGIVLVLEPTNNNVVSSLQHPPQLRIGGQSQTYKPTGFVQVNSFGGVPFNGWVIAYGGDGQPGQAGPTFGTYAGDNFFIEGIFPGDEKKFSIMFVN
tara:strand:+ start:5461 stop:6366 length:906 start_codon:yes stop_codon:yes gene_type:complete